MVSSPVFHASLTNNKVEVAIAPCPCEPPGLPMPPVAGKGLSDGPGTYRRKSDGNDDAPPPREQAAGRRGGTRGGGARQHSGSSSSR
eukprot:320298-Pyramimonas_sp.AAC.1